MGARASIVGAASTHVGKVREHNEDAHFLDAEAGVFLVCDGMGGHAAGEVASALAVRTIRTNWTSSQTQKLVDAWLDQGTPEAKKQLLSMVRAGVLAAHEEIIAEAERDEAKTGMGTTLVGAIVVGNEIVFAHAGDSRAYLVRDGISMQLTEDHTLLGRLLAAGIEVDVSGEGARFRSMLTNALGIGQVCKVSTFVVPLADGDRFLFCSDGISEYVQEAEIGEVLSKQPSPARAAQKLVDLALERGGGDNATSIVFRVLEAGDSPHPAEQILRDNAVIASCPLWGTKITPQQRLRALRIAIPREFAVDERLPANTLGDRVAWIIIEGALTLDGEVIEPGSVVYPESLVTDHPAPDRDGLALVSKEIRAVALRADDFRELCEDDTELGEALLEALGPLIAQRKLRAPALLDRAETELELEVDEEITLVGVAPIRRDEGGMGNELDERFDAVSGGGPVTAKPAATTERIPLTVKPRAAVIPAPRTPTPSAGVGVLREATPPAKSTGPIPAIPSLPRRTNPSMAAIPIPPPGRLAPQLIPTPPRKRPPTEPEIETVIELEADSPPIEEPERTTTDSGEHAVMSLSVEDTEGRVTETVTDTSEQTLTVTVTELEPPPPPPPPAAPPPLPPAVQAKRKPGRIVEDDRPHAVSGTINEAAVTPPPRPKRLSEGWDD